jgi:hypothetical protein
MATWCILSNPLGEIARDKEIASLTKGVCRNVRVTNPIHTYFGQLIPEGRLFSHGGELELWFEDEHGLIMKIAAWATDVLQPSCEPDPQRRGYLSLPQVLALTRN